MGLRLAGRWRIIGRLWVLLFTAKFLVFAAPVAGLGVAMGITLALPACHALHSASEVRRKVLTSMAGTPGCHWPLPSSSLRA